MWLEPLVIEAAVELFTTRPETRLAGIPERSVGHNFWARAKALERDCYVDDPDIMAARVFDRDYFFSINGYDESLNGTEDWDLSQRARGRDALAVLPHCLWHDEGRIRLLDQARKKFYYARSFARYVRKHPGQARGQANLLFRQAYFRHWRELARQPGLTAGMFVLRLVEGLAGAAGIAYEANAARNASKRHAAA
jgi:arabinofuranan 3-O-arabinosyltransferase